MPLYLVRWPDLKASLIKAKDEDELVDLIDQVGDPGGCTWKKYTGPVWIDFQVPVELKETLRDDDRPIAREQLELDGVEQLARKDFWLVSSIPTFSGEASEMYEHLTREAFPGLAKSLDCESPAVTELRAGLLEDLDPLIKYDWRRTHIERRTDGDAMLMKALGNTVMTPKLGRPRD